MKLNGWQKVWVVMTLSWIIFVAVLAYRESEGVSLFRVFQESIILPIALYLLGLLVAWVIRSLKREKRPDLDESLRAKSEAYAKWMKTKTDEDYQIYLELKEAREKDVEERGYRSIYDK